MDQIQPSLNPHPKKLLLYFFFFRVPIMAYIMK